MKALGRWLWGWTKSIVVALVVWFAFSTFVLQAFWISSSSMQNTLLIGDVLFVNKLLYGAEVPLVGKRLPAIRKPARNDILVFDSVEELGLKVVKRLVGVPGDTIAMTDGILLRNGRPVDEPWVAAATRHARTDEAGREQIRRWQAGRVLGDSAAYRPDPDHWGPLVVPTDSFFMMGDNRRDSYDSRFWGFVPRRNIRGTPLITYFSYDKETYKPLPMLTAIRWRRLFRVPR